MPAQAPDTPKPSPSGRLPREVIILLLATSVHTAGDGALHLLIGPHLEQQGLTRAAIGGVIASYSVAALLSRLPAGSVHRLDLTLYLVPAGCLTSAAAFVLIGSSSGALSLGALMALNGVGFAVASTGGLAALMEVSPRDSAGSIMGWYTGAIGAGYAISSFLGGAMGDLLGVQGAIRAVALIPALAAFGLAFALVRVTPTSEPAVGGPTLTIPPRRFYHFRTVSPSAWIAFAVALHINLIGGLLSAFFPLYGLSIGLSLSQVGVLKGLHSTVSSLSRFGSALLFRRVSHERLMPWMVLLGGAAVAGLTGSTRFALLLGCWLGIGLSRGLLRVSSAALVMETSGPTSRDKGAASSVYLSGLDVGKILGPTLGGFSAHAVGYGTTFVIAGVAFPLIFLGLWRVLQRNGPSDPIPRQPR